MPGEWSKFFVTAGAEFVLENKVFWVNVVVKLFPNKLGSLNNMTT